jgi:hypothetical protein
MSDAPSYPPLEIDPRKVERLERYLQRYARTHALDPLEHLRRERAGSRFLAALRVRWPVLDRIAKARAEGKPLDTFLSTDRHVFWAVLCRPKFSGR